MARWKKLEVDIYAKMRGLSPDAERLYLFLRCSDVTTMLPGLQEVGPAQLAERLRLTSEGFAAAWHEIEAQGLGVADWQARLVYLPGVLEVDPPLSPNVVTGWARDLGTLPRCPLLREAMKDFLEVFRERSQRPRNKGDKADPGSFLQAFQAVVSKSLPESIGFSSGPEGGKSKTKTKAETSAKTFADPYSESSPKSHPKKKREDIRRETEERELLYSMSSSTTSRAHEGEEMEPGTESGEAIILEYNHTLAAIGEDIGIKIPALGVTIDAVNRIDELIGLGYTWKSLTRAVRALPFSEWHMGFPERIQGKERNGDGDYRIIEVGRKEREPRWFLEDILKVSPKNQIEYLNSLYVSPPNWAWKKYGPSGAVFLPLMEEWKGILLEACWEYEGMDKVMELIDAGANLVDIIEALEELQITDERFSPLGGL